MSHRAILIFLLSAFAAVLLCLSACDSGGGNEDVDGDVDTAEPEFEGAVCTEGVSSCDGTIAIICYEGQWQTLDDCANYGKVCEKGICVYPSDGDAEEESEFESEDTDGDDTDNESTDNINPFVESTAPLQDQEDVPISLTIILINFSEVMDATKISPIQRSAAVTGHCDVDLSFTAEIRAGGKQLKLTLNENLHPGTTHHVVLNPEKWFDEAGNPLGEYTLAFTTEGEAPDTPCADGDEDSDIDSSQNPYMESTVPANAQMGVALDLDDVKIKFSQKMETYNYDLAANITVTGDDAHDVDFSGSWILNDQWIRLDLLENLHADTDYTVSLAAGLESNAGAYPLGAVSFWFSTSEPQIDGDEEIDLDPEAEADVDVDGTPPSNILEVDDVNYSMAYDAPYNPVQHPRSVEADWSVDTEKIIIVHHNVPYDHNLSGLSADMTQTGWRIELFETASVLVPDGTDYPYDVTIELDGAADFPGEWDVAVYYDGALEPDETDVVVP